MDRIIAWMAAAIVAATGYASPAADEPAAGAALLTTVAPATPASRGVAASPTVNLNGPGTVRPSVQCYWWAYATGGTPPYSYSWSGGLSGYSIAYEYFTTSPSSGSFTVSVTVTDALGATATDSRSVTVNSRASICPY
jgi:hypothetical protein